MKYIYSAQELCERGGGRPGPSVPNSSYGQSIFYFMPVHIEVILDNNNNNNNKHIIIIYTNFPTGL